MTIADAANRIRSNLKAAGIGARAVSVRVTAGGSINVTIRSADVDGATVSRIAHAEEKIDRCHLTGEILAGGNTLIFVSVADDVAAPIAAGLPDGSEGPILWRDREIWLVDGCYTVRRGTRRLSTRAYTLADAIKVAILDD